MYGSDFFIIKSDHKLISESIERIIMTNFNERLKHPFFGGDFKRLLFEQADEESIAFIKRQITEQIEIYEPRVRLTQVEVENLANENTFNIHIGFTLVDDVSDERFLEFNITNQE